MSKKKKTKHKNIRMNMQEDWAKKPKRLSKKDKPKHRHFQNWLTEE